MRRKIFFLLLMAFCLMCTPAVAKDDLEIVKLQAEMLRLISTDERDHFLEVTEELKRECLKQGNERLFFTAWSNQATYEATHLDYKRAGEIAEEITEYASGRRFDDFAFATGDGDKAERINRIPLHVSVFLCVAITANKFKVVPIQCDIRITDVIRVKVYLVVNDNTRRNNSVTQTPFTQPALAFRVSPRAVLPCP